ncbi:hypothetical protein [Dinoroseobacter sp. S124A]|uniref:hypothetical protein n=1 Tax=Dinoroseobacter sp. S124A TaxID=3415128 RepID=UPI003C7E11A1
MIVGNSLELSRAVSKLPGGGEILLEDGYYRLKRFSAGPESGHLTIKPAPGARPVLQSLDLNKCRNMLFEGIRFRNGEDGKGGASLLRCDNVTLLDCNCKGGAIGYVGRGDPVPGSFVMVRSSNNCHILGCDIFKYWHAASFLDCTGCSFMLNRVWNMAGDGLRMAGVQDMRADGNTFRAFYGSAQDRNHTDMVQIFTAPFLDLDTKRVSIIGNTLDCRGGRATQSIFILNERFGATGVPFEDLRIEGNNIRNGHVHGVHVANAIRSRIIGNTLQWDREAFIRYPKGDENSQPIIRILGVRDGLVEAGNRMAD